MYLFLFFVEVVTAAIIGQFVTREFTDSRQQVQQCTVVTDDERCGRGTAYKIIKTLSGRSVQVIGRFIQQDNIGCIQFHAGKKQTGFLSATQSVQSAGEGQTFQAPYTEGGLGTFFNLSIILFRSELIVRLPCRLLLPGCPRNPDHRYLPELPRNLHGRSSLHQGLRSHR